METNPSDFSKAKFHSSNFGLLWVNWASWLVFGEKYPRGARRFD